MKKQAGRKARGCSMRGPLKFCDIYCWDFETCLKFARERKELERKISEESL